MYAVLTAVLSERYNIRNEGQAGLPEMRNPVCVKDKVLSTIEEIKIYSDPYRIQIMNMFHRQGRPSTVKEIADLMGRCRRRCITM